MRNDMETYLLRTEGMDVGYHGVPLIRDITIQVKKGEILTLIGPNGSGKSTILKSLIGQLSLLAGTVFLDGQDMGAMGVREAARRLSILMTERVRPERMTCGDVVAAGRYPYTGRLGVLSKRDWAAVRETMELICGQELFSTPFAQISDGQRQRVLLARAICQEPDVIVLDEPTTFLDIRYKMELLSILKRLVTERGLAVVMSLHELDLAQKVSDQVLCIHDGRVERSGPPEEIFSGPYIQKLYGITRGSYSERFGSLELEAVSGAPQVFVIGGNGSGIPVYRRLQREGVPFAAGILPENDVDYEVARALAAQVVAEEAYQPVREETFQKARAILSTCSQVICCLSQFGPLNEYNRLLAQAEPQKTVFAARTSRAGPMPAE